MEKGGYSIARLKREKGITEEGGRRGVKGADDGAPGEGVELILHSFSKHVAS